MCPSTPEDDAEDHPTVWEACHHPLPPPHQETHQRNIIHFVPRIGIIVAILIYLAWLPQWSICQEEVKFPFYRHSAWKLLKNSHFDEQSKRR